MRSPRLRSSSWTRSTALRNSSASACGSFAGRSGTSERRARGWLTVMVPMATPGAPATP